MQLDFLRAVASQFALLSLAVAVHAEEPSIFYIEPGAGVSFAKSSDPGLKGANTGGTAQLNLGWRFDYVHLMLLGRGSYYPADGGDKRIWDYGGGFGWEWSIPVMTTLFAGGTSLEAPTDGRSRSVYGNGFWLGITFAYFITENIKLNLALMPLAYQYDSAGKDSSSKGRFATLSVSFPFEMNYPERSWR